MENQIKLKLSSISRATLNSYANDFTFIINEEEFKTNKIISDIISPKIAQIHSVDPTFDIFTINTNNKGSFSYILNLLNFEVNIIPTNQFDFIIEVVEILGNDSFEIVSTMQEQEISQDIVFDLLKKHERHNLYSNLLSNEINFVSSHFYQLYENYPEKINDLSISIIERIIKSDKLLLNNEDQLLSFINQLYMRDSKYSVLYENVFFSFVSVSKISEFIQIFDISDLNTETWISISHRLQQEISIDYNAQNEKRYIQNFGGISFIFKNNKFDGIINYLRSQGDIQNLINFSSSSVENSFHPPQYSIEKNNFFASENKPNSWVILDFKEHRIIPTNYTIGSTNNSYHPINWTVEGSTDNVNWGIIDVQENCQSMNGNNVVQTFDIKKKNNAKFQYLRIRQTGPSSCNNNFFRFNSFEIFGTLF